MGMEVIAENHGITSILNPQADGAANAPAITTTSITSGGFLLSLMGEKKASIGLAASTAKPGDVIWLQRKENDAHKIPVIVDGISDARPFSQMTHADAVFHGFSSLEAMRSRLALSSMGLSEHAHSTHESQMATQSALHWVDTTRFSSVYYRTMTPEELQQHGIDNKALAGDLKAAVADIASNHTHDNSVRAAFDRLGIVGPNTASQKIDKAIDQRCLGDYATGVLFNNR